MDMIESLEKCIVILGSIRPRVDQPDIFHAAKAVINELAAVHAELKNKAGKEDNGDGTI